MLIDNNIEMVGVVGKSLSGDSTRVKIVSFKDQDNGEIFDPDQIREKFPYSGHVFGPSFFKYYENLKLKEMDLISLQYEENPYPKTSIDPTKNNYDIYTVAKNSVQKLNYMVGFNLKPPLPIIDKFIDLTQISIPENFSGHFCLIDNGKIYGKLRIVGVGNRDIEPIHKKRVYVWSINDCHFIPFDQNYSYVKIPENNYHDVLDCMGNKRLFEWFREKLNQLDTSLVSKLDNTTKWRENFPKLFDQNDQENYDLDAYRLKRVLRHIEKINLTVADIELLLSRSEALKNVFAQSIETHKNDFKDECQDELDEYRKSCHQKKLDYEKDLQKIENKIVKKEKTLKQLEQMHIEYEQQINHILENKDRILSDFSIVNDVLKLNSCSINQIENTYPLGNDNSYIVEEIGPDPADTDTEIRERSVFIKRLAYFLDKSKLNSGYASRFLDSVISFPALLIENPCFAIAFAKTLGNVKYIVQQVEPDWLHFKKLWQNGLGELWESSHKDPNIMHLLILEDVNLSSPECYARPLMDVINGVRDRIPFGKSEMPANLRIMASPISWDEPSIGLPIFSTTFQGWGALGFRSHGHKADPPTDALPGGYVTPNTLSQLRDDDEYDPDGIVQDTENEFKSLFEGD
ncbi:MAG: hypothetical protein HQK65_05760 [Desulfamplus sp.]|nr:hypothetical protein [Desulfamplus sp.]